MEQTHEEILESLKKQKKAKTNATAVAGWLLIASIVCLGAGVVAGNKLVAVASLCWFGGSVIATIAAKETQDREEIERRIEFIIRTSDLKCAVEAATKSVKAEIRTSLSDSFGYRNHIGLN